MSAVLESGSSSNGRVHRALLVDDNADVRFLARCLLEGHGFEISEADSGPAALELLASERPDIVLLDVQMPEMDGWETLESIRGNPATASLRVVLWTVKGRPEDVVRGWELGCDGYLAKPFDARQLEVEVKRVVSRDEVERARHRADRLAEAREELAAARA
jgi:DNA-binding response OmpR family regulator